MKLMIDGMEVTISVKAADKQRATKKDTFYFLSEISGVFGRTGLYYADKYGVEGLAGRCFRIQHDIYTALDEEGFYDNQKEA